MSELKAEARAQQFAGVEAEKDKQAAAAEREAKHGDIH